MVALLRYMARANQAAQTVTHHIHTYRAVFKAPMHIHIGTCTCIRDIQGSPTHVCMHTQAHTHTTDTYTAVPCAWTYKSTVDMLKDLMSLD